MAPSAVVYDSKAGLEKLQRIIAGAVQLVPVTPDVLADLHDSVAEWVEALGEYLSAVSFVGSEDAEEE